MRGRAIDLALVVGLLIVAGAIVWTLFSLGGERRASPPSDDGAITSPSGGGVVPIAPDGTPESGSADDAGASGAAGGADGGGAADGGVQPLAPDGDGSPAAGTEPAGTPAAGSSGPGPGPGPDPDRPNPEIAAADAPPVPASGPAELGRVGFSFVTGGAGACGIVLEPWTHVAVSRELLEAYGCGAEVTLTLDEAKDGRTEVQAIVADTMNEAFSRTVNVYVGEDEPALQYGLTSGTITRR